MVSRNLPAPIERLNDTRRRINRVIDFIDEHLDHEMLLAELADIACLSPFHFQRLYARMVGRTPSETIRGLRLLRARDQIVFDAASPQEAAHRAGYASLTSFARAYWREFDRSPAEIRPEPKPTPRPLPLRRFTIVELQAQTMAATSYSGQRLAMDPLTVDTQAYASHLGIPANGKALAIYHDDFLTPYDQAFRCDLCFPADHGKLPDVACFADVVVPGGLYACVEQRGLLFDLAPHWAGFVGGPLAQSGWRPRPGPVLRWFFSDRAITPPSQRLAYLYIPVEQPLRH
ncbi:MAG: AraC family transcriptional regulator [Alphaproteobacteria bacterium]|jgi:AraC family transcriptional regulator|nr:AraC family transcriptional regulator [Alphaproteobacteria bacterium]